uniref:Uncharacterized protein n=2 Tax=Clastoptera arizonana TaxID=38151 RepID=A0A1B6C9Z3_9HEMI
MYPGTIVFKVYQNDLLYDSFEWEVNDNEIYLVFKNTVNNVSSIRNGLSNRLVDGYSFSIFYNCFIKYPSYRSRVFDHIICQKSLPSSVEVIKCFNLVMPKKEIIDYAWGYRLYNLVAQRCELDCAMNTLSTIGGAYSALGNDKIDFALEAGKISLNQFKIALHLGDPMTVLRCKLYYSLSLIQMGQLKTARIIIKKQFDIAKSASVLDKRVISMCYGIWSRLQHEYKIKKLSL